MLDLNFLEQYDFIKKQINEDIEDLSDKLKRVGWRDLGDEKEPLLSNTDLEEVSFPYTGMTSYRMSGNDESEFMGSYQVDLSIAVRITSEGNLEYTLGANVSNRCADELATPELILARADMNRYGNDDEVVVETIPINQEPIEHTFDPESDDDYVQQIFDSIYETIAEYEGTLDTQEVDFLKLKEKITDPNLISVKVIVGEKERILTPSNIQLLYRLSESSPMLVSPRDGGGMQGIGLTDVHGPTFQFLGITEKAQREARYELTFRE